MDAWNRDELDRVGRAEELQLASHRPDGSLRPYVTIWVVRAGDDLYVRSAHGPDNAWFWRAVTVGHGRIQAGGVEADVDFNVVDTKTDTHTAIDAAYHTKYDRYGPAIVNTVVGPAATGVTIRLTPRQAS